MPHYEYVSDSVTEGIMARRGRLQITDRLEARRTAGAVVDMQNFCVAEADTAISIVPDSKRPAATGGDRGAPAGQWQIRHDGCFTGMISWTHPTRPGNDGASDLQDAIQGPGIEILIATDTATGMCGESTARDAMTPDDRTVLVEDANAARYDDSHPPGLTVFHKSFGEVGTTGQTMATRV